MEVLEKMTSKELSSQDVPDRPSTPYDCAICLEHLTDKSFTNSCLHTFCFRCLLAWSKVKPECPLCKQDFRSIFHNIRSIDDFDEYHVPPAEARLQLTPPFANTNNNQTGNVLGDTGHDFFSNHRRFFAYRTTAMPSGFSVPRERSPNLVIQPYVDNLELQSNFSRANTSHPLYSRSNRREIYLKELETLPPPTGGRYRECSPEFYTENEGQLHRLARWLQRELFALSQIGVRFVHHELQHLIMDLLRLYNINSDIFHNIVNRYLGAHTSRFIREFYSFATSPYEMEQYDRECVYVRQRTGSHLSFIVTVGRDDTEEVQVIPSTSLDQPVRPWIDVNDLNTTHYHVTGSGIQISARVHRNAFQRTNRSTMPNNTAVSSHSVINISDSENDDCVIIDEVRTTPETIILDDSDRENESHSRVTPIRLSASSCAPLERNSVPLDLSTTRSPSPVSVLDIQVIPSSSQLPNSVVTSASCIDVKKNTSKREEEKLPEAKPNKIKHRKRNPSVTSSVLSTDVSSDEIDQNKSSIKNKRKKTKKCVKTKNPKRGGTSRHRKKSSSVDFTVFSSDSYSVESDKNDLDWEQTRYKRKKKIKKVHAHKREKKNSPKKRKKTTYEHKSQKKKKVSVSISDSSDSVDSDDKYERKTKSYKNKLGVASNSNISNQCIKSFHVECETPELLQRSSAPKLRSIVKKVNNRVETLSNGLNRHSNYYNTRNSSDYETITDLPSTSYGYTGYRDHRAHSINYFNNSYSSDSD